MTTPRTTYSWDAADRLLERRHSDGTPPTTFAYDAAGNRTLAWAADGRTTNAFDTLDRVSAVTHPVGGRVTSGYDARGSRTSLTRPDGGVTAYGYDAAGRNVSILNPVGERTTLGYDAVGRNITRLSSNPAGYNDVTFRTSHVHDAAGWLTDVVNRRHDGTAPARIPTTAQTARMPVMVRNPAFPPWRALRPSGPKAGRRNPERPLTRSVR